MKKARSPIIHSSEPAEHRWLDTDYPVKCNCGNEYLFRTQKDDWPEYYTEIFMKCPCGAWIEMQYPVN